MTGKIRNIFVFLTLILVISFFVTVNAETGHPQSNLPEDEKTELTSINPENHEISEESFNELYQVVKKFLQEGAIVGGELAIIRDGQPLLHQALGWKDREDELSLEINTLFNIRSMTKTLTGAAIHLLIDRGKLSPDDKISKYLPGFDNDKSGSITIEQLLTHRGGLPLTILSTADEYDDLYTMANAVGERGPDFEPGNKFWYSDAGADVLGAVIEVVGGIPLDRFIEENLLIPLEMKDTFYYVEATRDDPRKDRIASLYIGGKESWMRAWSPEEIYYPFTWGSQSLYSTPLDYARFLAMLMGKGK